MPDITTPEYSWLLTGCRRGVKSRRLRRRRRRGSRGRLERSNSLLKEFELRESVGVSRRSED